MASAAQNSLDIDSLVVRSESLKRIVQLVEQVARHPAAVLVVGETGTGKEMIARAIHSHSLRCNQPLIDVNCAAIPEHLVESELFGYEKGAFSGADTMKPGLFELADKGTLFLDEIGDLDPKVQVKLLRVLDGVPYYRLGGSKKVNVDVRVVAATNQNLEELARTGRFRSDLYHRLAQFKLEIPPLRERPEDLLGIAEQILREHYPTATFGKDAIAALLAYRWPGNVRELRNAIFKAVMHAARPQTLITAADLQLPHDPATRNGSGQLDGDLNQIERQMIAQALEKCGGNQGKAAQALGISRRTLIRKLKSYRESGEEGGSGSLSSEQQHYYRAHLDLPVRLKYGTEQAPATLANLSLGGAAVAVEKPLDFGLSVSIYFNIPETEGETELPGRVVWSNKGSHGIQFSDLPAAVRTNLQRWLMAQMKKDGWEGNIAV